MRLGDDPELRRLAGSGNSGRSNPSPRGQQRSGQQRSQGGGSQQQQQGLPARFVLDTFYGPDGKLRQEIFYDLPRELAQELSRAGLSSKSLRSVFTAFHSFAAELEAGRIDFPTAKERFHKMYVERVQRQVGRRILPRMLQEFFDRHLDLALRDEREMLGLFQYLKNVCCYLPEK